MSRRRAHRAQRGAVLLIMLAILGLGSTWFVVSALNAETGGIEAKRKQHNAEILRRAKMALIGYIAAQAIKAGENNPGAMPCPENPGDFDSTTGREGLVGTSCGTTTIGRFPWRTLGLEKLTDAAGEPLWYVVGPGWGVLSGSNTVINSNSVGQLRVDGADNAAVALIIAPGPAISAPASTGCIAWNQVRSASGNPDYRNYLECENGAFPVTSTFVTSKPPIVTPNPDPSKPPIVTPVTNDQVIAITVSDIMPALEAAIAKRIEREIAPVLATVYGDALWGTSASAPAFPFPATFTDPSTAGFLGQTNLTQGLLPFNYHSASCPGGDPRCLGNSVSWTSATPTFSTSGGPGYLPSSTSCYWSGSTRVCEGFYYGGAMNLHFTDRANNITTGMRTFTASSHNGTVVAWNWNGGGWDPSTSFSATTSRTLLNTGAVNFITTAALPSVSTWGYYQFSRNRPADANFDDHALIKADDPVTGWFARNEWYRLAYYAIAPGHAPGAALSCSDSGTCVQVTNLADPAKQRAVIALMGRSLPALSQVRPSILPQNYLDSLENRNGDLIFVQSPINNSFNDRFISIAKNP
jgi:hypothetical protein